MRDPRFDILFEKVRIGPVEARNRFYQTPHCNGMGNLRPQAHATMRGIKAEGGWAVANAEHCSVHPPRDVMPECCRCCPPDHQFVDEVHSAASTAANCWLNQSGLSELSL